MGTQASALAADSHASKTAGAARLFYREAKRHFSPSSSLRRDMKRQRTRALRRSERASIAASLAD